MHSFVADRWNEKLINLTASGALNDIGMETEGVAIPKRLADLQDVVVTSQLRYSQPERVLCAQAFQKKNQVGVKDLLAKVNAEQGNITVMVTAPVLSRTAFVASRYEILVSHVHNLMSMELGLDLDALLLEIEFIRDEEDDPHGDLGLTDHCVVVI